MNIDFDKAFLSIDFDNILTSVNNDLVNDQLYLKAKEQYFQKSLYNKSNFNELLRQISDTQEHNTIADEQVVTHYFTYNDKNSTDTLHFELHKLIDEQTKLYKNFLHYTNMLNSASYTVTTPTITTNQSAKPSSIKSTKSNKSMRSLRNKFRF